MLILRLVFDSYGHNVTPRWSQIPWRLVVSPLYQVERIYRSKFFFTFQSIKKGQGKNNSSCAQLHIICKLLKIFSEINVKWLHELWFS